MNKNQYISSIGLSESTYLKICKIMRYTGTDTIPKGYFGSPYDTTLYIGSPCVTTLLNNLDSILQKLGNIPESDKKIIQNLVDAQQAKGIEFENRLSRIKTAAKKLKPTDSLGQLRGILSTRILNVLAEAGIFTVKDLMQFIKTHGMQEIGKFRTMGKNYVKEIEQLAETVKSNVSEADKLNSQLREIDANIADFKKSREEILKRLYETEQSSQNIVTQSQINNQKE